MKHLWNNAECEPKCITNNELEPPKINDIYLYPKFRILPGFLEQQVILAGAWIQPPGKILILRNNNLPPALLLSQGIVCKEK